MSDTISISTIPSNTNFVNHETLIGWLLACQLSELSYVSIAELLDQHPILEQQGMSLLNGTDLEISEGNFTGNYFYENGEGKSLALLVNSKTPGRKTLYVIFTGSDKLKDYYYAVQHREAYYKKVNPFVEACIKYVQKHHEIDTIFCAGHSLGGYAAQKTTIEHKEALDRFVDRGNKVGGLIINPIGLDRNDLNQCNSYTAQLKRIVIDGELGEGIGYFSSKIETIRFHCPSLKASWWDYSNYFSDKIKKHRLTNMNEVLLSAYHHMTKYQAAGLSFSATNLYMGSDGDDVIDRRAYQQAEAIFTKQGKDTVFCGSGDNYVYDYGRDEKTFFGNKNADVFCLDEGKKTIDGGEGQDTIMVKVLQQETNLTYLPFSQNYLLSHSRFEFLFKNIETLCFKDITVTLLDTKTNIKGGTSLLSRGC